MLTTKLLKTKRMVSFKLDCRKALSSDLPFLIELRKATMRKHYLNAGLAYNDEEQTKRIKDRFDLAKIILFDGQDIGLLKIDQASVPWALHQIQILPVHQKKGLGEQILRQITGEAKKSGASIQLGVLKNNPAKRLYERVGFRVLEEKETAYVMRFL
jgi:ribosomal protein S18 acetylase RimI-like enzyme